MALAQYMSGAPLPEMPYTGSKRFGSVTYDPLLVTDPGPSKHFFSSVISDPPPAPPPAPPENMHPLGFNIMGKLASAPCANNPLVSHLPGVHNHNHNHDHQDHHHHPGGAQRNHQARRFGSLESETSLVSECGSDAEAPSPVRTFPECLPGYAIQVTPARETPPPQVGLQRRGSLSSNSVGSSVTLEDANTSPINALQSSMAVPTALDTVLEITKQVPCMFC